MKDTTDKQRKEFETEYTNVIGTDLTKSDTDNR